MLMRLLQIISRLTGFPRLDDKARYVRRWKKRLQKGRMHSTLGLAPKDEATTRSKAEQWLDYLIRLGLKPEHVCVEIGCGSLWAAEPVIKYLQPGRYIGLDITEYFYQLGRERIGSLLEERGAELAVISEATLAKAAARRPNLVFARKVLAHVKPPELPQFVANFCALLGPDSLAVIDNPKVPRTHLRNPGTIDYALADFAAHLPPGFVCDQDERAIFVRRKS
jgi:Methyltransferase domain